MKMIALLLTFLIGFSANAEVKMDQTNTLVFNGFISAESMDNTYDLLKAKSDKLKKKEPLFLIINSPGGEVKAANDFIKKTKKLGRPVNTVTMLAAGAAFHLVQGLDKRYATEESVFVLIKPATGGFAQEITDLVFRSKFEEVVKLVKDSNAVDAKRMKMSAELYEKLAENEYWANTVDAAKLGMYDELLYFTNGVMLHNFILGGQYER